MDGKSEPVTARDQFFCTSYRGFIPDITLTVRPKPRVILIWVWKRILLPDNWGKGRSMLNLFWLGCLWPETRSGNFIADSLLEVGPLGQKSCCTFNSLECWFTNNWLALGMCKPRRSYRQWSYRCFLQRGRLKYLTTRKRSIQRRAGMLSGLLSSPFRDELLLPHSSKDFAPKDCVRIQEVLQRN
jgi:hypothetical protein